MNKITLNIFSAHLKSNREKSLNSNKSTISKPSTMGKNMHARKLGVHGWSLFGKNNQQLRANNLMASSLYPVRKATQISAI